MLDNLRENVCAANLLLPKYNLVTFTWGNVSGIDREKGLMVIKPSGLEYENMTPDDMVIVDIETGKVVEGKLKPSSDTPTHIELYKAFQSLGGIVHTHSRWATIFAQSKKKIPALGTTHADYFYGDIPCTRELKETEIMENYEKNTALVIIEKFKGVDPLAIPSVIVSSHGPFAWGLDPITALHNAVVLEEVSMMAWHSLMISGEELKSVDKFLLEKHYFRKHGVNAYYGQNK